MDARESVAERKIREACSTGQAIVFRGLPAGPCEGRRQKAIACPHELNRRILTYNLKSPSTHFHKRRFELEADIGE